MPEGGFIKAWRSMLTHPIFQHDGMFRLWMYILFRANWKETSQLAPRSTVRLDLPRGAFATTRSQLHESMYGNIGELMLEFPDLAQHVPHQNTLWRWLLSLESMGCVTVKAIGKRFSIVTVCNYDIYQNQEKKEEQQHEQQASNRMATELKSILISNEELEEGKNVEPPQNCDRPIQVAGENPAAWITTQWFFYRQGFVSSRETREAVTQTFEQMIRLGISAETITNEVRSKPLHTEPIFKFENRILQAHGRSSGSHASKPSNAQNSMNGIRSAFDWANEVNNDQG